MPALHYPASRRERDRLTERRSPATGGEVAQYLAADHGELIRRLVLSDTGCRLGEDAKALLRAARDKAAQGRAAEAQADIATTWTSDGSAKAC